MLTVIMDINVTVLIYIYIVWIYSFEVPSAHTHTSLFDIIAPGMILCEERYKDIDIKRYVYTHLFDELTLMLKCA